MSDQPKWMPSDEEIRASIEGTEMEYDTEIGVFTDVNLEPIRALILEAVRAHDSERFGQYLLDMRGIDGEPCRECGGVGVKAYSNTSTWRGGVGGQMITNAVCDRCWGSGDPDRPWVNLRTLKSDQEQAIRAAVEKALAEQEARHREDLRVITEATRMAADKRAERHKRELIEARIYELEEYGDCICERYSDPTLNVRHRDCEVCKHLDSLRAELAALDKDVDK